MLRRFLKTSRFSEVTVALSIRGWLRKWSNFKRGAVDVQRLQKKIVAGTVRRISFDTKNIAAFEQTIKEVRSRGIQLVLLYIPTLDVLNAVEPEKYAEAIRKFETYAAADPGVIFLNYNPDLSARHELFYDSIHMNPAGQNVVTRRLAVDLARILDHSN